MRSMVSVEGEEVPLSQEIDPAKSGAVEKWMLEFEDVMKESIHKVGRRCKLDPSLKAHPVSKFDW